MAKHTEKARRVTRKSKKSRGRRVQRGGGLKEEAMQVLADNHITDLEQFLFDDARFVPSKTGMGWTGQSYSDVTFGEYVFTKGKVLRDYRLHVYHKDKPSEVELVYSYSD